MQMSTTRSPYDQYCISHKTISHRAAAVPGPEVHRACPMTGLLSLPRLATNPSDAIADEYFPLLEKEGVPVFVKMLKIVLLPCKLLL